MQQPDNHASGAWHKYFTQLQIALATVAAKQPERGLVAATRDKVYQLYAWDVASGDLRQLTKRVGGVIFGGISPDGRFVYYLDEDDGHYVRIAYDANDPSPQNISPDLPAYESASISQSLNGSVLGFAATTDQNTSIYTQPVAENGDLGERAVLYTTDASAYGPWFDHNATYAVIATTEITDSADHGLMAFPLDNADQATVRVLHDANADMTPVAFALLPGDTRLLATTDATGVIRPMIWDVSNGDRIDLPLDDIDGDIGVWGWSPDGERLLLFRVHHAHYQLYVYDLKRSTLTALNHADGAYFGGFFLNTDEIVTVWTDGTHPAQVITLDATTGTQQRTLIASGDDLKLEPWRSIRFQSGGGAQIQAWLATPDRSRFGDGPYPTIIRAHDGPFDAQLHSYHPEAATWLTHGVAWLSVNYRGSTTFGPEHQGSIIGIPGHREVDDLVAARAWLIAQGIAHPDQVFLNGDQYGGMLVLQTLGRHPEGWAGGIAVDPIVQWQKHYERVSPAEQAFIDILFGGPPEAYASLYKASSPLTYVDAVEAPVFIGRAQSRAMVVQYIDELQDADKDVRRVIQSRPPNRAYMKHILLWVYSHLNPKDNR